MRRAIKIGGFDFSGFHAPHIMIMHEHKKSQKDNKVLSLHGQGKLVNSPGVSPRATRRGSRPPPPLFRHLVGKTPFPAPDKTSIGRSALHLEHLVERKETAPFRFRKIKEKITALFHIRLRQTRSQHETALSSLLLVGKPIWRCFYAQYNCCVCPRQYT